MTTIITPSVSSNEKKYIRRRIQRSFDPGFWVVSPPSGFPEQIAGPATGNPFKDFQRRMGRAVCDRWARGDRPGIIPFRDSYYREMCEPYLGAGLPGAPSTGSQFSGGQCDADGGGYSVTIQYTDNLGSPGSATRRMRGPLSDARFFSTVPNGSQGRLEMRGKNATTNSNCAIPLPDAGLQYFPFTSVLNRFGNGAVVDSVTVTPCPGFPNNCGDPDSVFEPGEPNPTPDPNPGPVGGPTGYPFPNFDIDINPDGTIEIDFGDGSDPEVFDPASEPDSATDGPPLTPGDPGAIEDTGDGGAAEGEAEDGEELTGVLVEILSSHPEANKLNRVNVNVFRGIGFVAMGYPGLLGVDTSASVFESPQFFHAQQRGLTNWRVRACVGFSLRATPYYREV